MKRDVERLVYTPFNYTDSGGNQWTDSAGNHWTGESVENIPPVLLTVPLTSHRLTIPARKAYSAGSTITLMATGNVLDSSSNTFTASGGNRWTMTVSVAQNAKPFFLTIPTTDTTLIVKE